MGNDLLLPLSRWKAVSSGQQIQIHAMLPPSHTDAFHKLNHKQQIIRYRHQTKTK